MGRISINIKETKELLKEKADRYWKLYAECSKNLEKLEKQLVTLQMDLVNSENKLILEKEKAIKLEAKFEMLKNLFKPSILSIDNELPKYGIKDKENYFKEI